MPVVWQCMVEAPGSAQKPQAEWEPWTQWHQEEALEEAGYQPPEATTGEKDLVELLRTFENKLPSEVIAGSADQANAWTCEGRQGSRGQTCRDSP